MKPRKYEVSYRYWDAIQGTVDRKAEYLAFTAEDAAFQADLYLNNIRERVRILAVEPKGET